MCYRTQYLHTQSSTRAGYDIIDGVRHNKLNLANCVNLVEQLLAALNFACEIGYDWLCRLNPPIAIRNLVDGATRLSGRIESDNIILLTSVKYLRRQF